MLASCGSPSSMPTRSGSASPAPTLSTFPPSPTSTVASSVSCDGSTDVTIALQAAVDRGGTVTIGAGTCVLSNHIVVGGPVAVRGAGSASTFLVQHGAINIFDISADNVTVSDMNLDTATFNPGGPVLKQPKPGVLFSNANNTTVTNVTGEAGSGFGMRFVGPSPCFSYQRGGTTLRNIDMTTTGTGGFASVDVDCQNHATLSNITIHGGILALFEDENVTLDGESFTPGPFAKTCAQPWYITGPSHHITVANVVSHGGHGIVKQPSDGITISGQTVDGPGC